VIRLKIFANLGLLLLGTRSAIDTEAGREPFVAVRLGASARRTQGGIHRGGDGVSRECGDVSGKRLKAVCREADRRCSGEPGRQPGQSEARNCQTQSPTDRYFAPHTVWKTSRKGPCDLSCDRR
jgi:hypothetical protein